MTAGLSPNDELLACTEDLGKRLKGGSIDPFRAFLEFTEKVEPCFEGFGVDNEDLLALRSEFPESISKGDSPFRVTLTIGNSSGIIVSIPVLVEHNYIGFNYGSSTMLSKTIVFPYGFDAREAGKEGYIENPVRVSTNVVAVNAKMLVRRVKEKVEELEGAFK